MVLDKKMEYVLVAEGEKMNADTAQDGLLDGLVVSKFRPTAERESFPENRLTRRKYVQPLEGTLHSGWICPL